MSRPTLLQRPELPTLTVVSTKRARDHIITDRLMVYALCVGGLAMGWYVAHATVLRSAKFTALSELPGWPEVWGWVLLTLGGLSLFGRSVGHRFGVLLATAAMLGMSVWYSVFAASLWIGTAEYGFVPYGVLAVAHVVFAFKTHRTRGFRPEQLDVTKVAAGKP